MTLGPPELGIYSCSSLVCCSTAQHVGATFQSVEASGRFVLLHQSWEFRTVCSSVRSRFEALRTEDEDFPITDEHDNPGLSGNDCKERTSRWNAESNMQTSIRNNEDQHT